MSTSLKLNLQGVLSGLPKNTSLGFGSFLAECQGVAWKSSRAGKALPCVAAGSAAVTFHCQQDDCEKQNHSTEQQGKDNVTPGIVLQAGHCQKRDKGWNMRHHCASWYRYNTCVSICVTIKITLSGSEESFSWPVPNFIITAIEKKPKDATPCL